MNSKYALPISLALSLSVVVLIVAFERLGQSPSERSQPSANDTFVPTSADEVLARLPAALSAGRRDANGLRALRAKLEQDPEDARTATDLASRYIDAARKTGSVRYLGYAEAALATWWQGTRPAPPGVLMARATVRQARHQFEAALADLREVIAMQPRNVGAWLTTSTVLKVLGRTPGALEACRPLARTAGALTAAACRANASAMTPLAGHAYAALTHALERSPKQPAAHRQWALWVHATLAAELGREAIARESFERALEVAPPDLNLIVSYADFLLDAGRPRDALEQLTRAGTATSVTLRREMAAAALQRRPSADAIARLRMHFQELALRGDSGQAGDEARFEFYVLGNTSRALELARRNFELHREPRDARLLLEIASASGTAHEAYARWSLTQAGLSPPEPGHADSSSSPGTAGSSA